MISLYMKHLTEINSVPFYAFCYFHETIFLQHIRKEGKLSHSFEIKHNLIISMKYHVKPLCLYLAIYI